jgi:hypothetical protein
MFCLLLWILYSEIVCIRDVCFLTTIWDQGILLVRGSGVCGYIDRLVTYSVENNHANTDSAISGTEDNSLHRQLQY